MYIRRLCLILLLGVPFLIHRLYQPLNESCTVKRFGCGCPPMTSKGAAASSSFNANHFNLILWCGIAIACGLSCWFLLRAEFTDRTSGRYLLAQSIGLFTVMYSCASRLVKEGWL